MRSTKPRRTPSLVESGRVRSRSLTPRLVRELKTRCWTGVGSRNPASSTSSEIGIAPSSTRFATNAGSSAPDNQPLSRHRRLNTLAHRWKVSESAESLPFRSIQRKGQAHRRFQASRAASAVAGTSSSRFSVPERTMSSQTTRSLCGSEQARDWPGRSGIQPARPQLGKPGREGRIWAVGQEERPAASCFRSWSCRSSRDKRVVAGYQNHTGSGQANGSVTKVSPRSVSAACQVPLPSAWWQSALR